MDIVNTQRFRLEGHAASKSRMSGLRRFLLLPLVASGCEREAAEDSTAETPVYGCWVETEWSADTTDDFARQSVTGTGSLGSRTQWVAERDSHEFSVESGASTYDGPLEASEYLVWIYCDSDNDGIDDYYSSTGWMTTDDTIYPGCEYPDLVLWANVKVRTATCD